jgi:transposase
MPFLLANALPCLCPRGFLQVSGSFGISVEIVSPSAAIKLMQRVRATGSAAPERYGGYRRPVLAPHAADLRRLVEATPDITLAEIQGELRRRLGVVTALSTIHYALRRIGLRHKKSR